MNKLHDVFSDAEQLLQYYEIQSTDFRMRHSAIWTEVKHYTWVLSFLIGAGPIALASGKNIGKPGLLVILILTMIGVFISLIAFLIIKRDFRYFTRADSRLLFIEKQLGVTSKSDYIDDRLARASSEKYSVLEDIESQTTKSKWYNNIFKIRHLILSTFIIYGFGATILSICYLLLFFNVLKM